MPWATRNGATATRSVPEKNTSCTKDAESWRVGGGGSKVFVNVLHHAVVPEDAILVCDVSPRVIADKNGEPSDVYDVAVCSARVAKCKKNYNQVNIRVSFGISSFFSYVWKSCFILMDILTNRWIWSIKRQRQKRISKALLYPLLTFKY